uniref:F-box domain-containing protein n=1 Tax=Kalanchoe fedtschenkoi TaxID=63787 RepID=A0A7N0UFC9_KALFE
MKGEASWISHLLDNSVEDSWELNTFPELNETKEASELCLDIILPDDLLERILAYLPIASIFRAGSVCKKWREITSSKTFLWYASQTLSQKPWYFMFTSSDEPIGYAYDPILRKWHGIELPCINTSNLFVASSSGLVCFMENDSRSELSVCNPITREYKKLQEPPGGGSPESRHGVITYDLTSKPSSHGTLIKSFISVPCSLTCGRLMNLKEKLVMVGGIGKPERPDIIKGIGIWVLNGKDWEEISRMPHRYFQGFGEFDDVFASSGTDNLIYIQSYGGPGLLVFDMKLKQWKWSQKCPVTKRFPLQLFTGFCFEPRLDISP